MIEAIPPPSYSRTAEILSRYRPIAPKPDAIPSHGGAASADGKIQQSPYLRTLLPQLHVRPARTRKRGRAPSTVGSLSSHPSSSSSKRHRSAAPTAHAAIPAVLPPYQYVFGSEHEAAGAAVVGTSARSLVTLPLLPGLDGQDCQKEEFVTAAAAVPEEKDLLQQLQVPRAAINNNNKSTPVISPRPVRPVGSSIVVSCMNEYMAAKDLPRLTRKAEEVEEEVESETLPAVISDSNGRVRLANSAYKEMVGQPECPWLDSVVAGANSRRMRISGDVILRFCDDTTAGIAEKETAGFQCWVRIEWGNGRKTSVKAVCDVRRLWCESKDYVFYWRIHAPAQRHC